MSVEHNMSRNSVRSSDALQSVNVSCTNDDTLEDAAGSANNSIIGKVKSRVSSIIPSSLSKWFSPSARINNDTSINGSPNTGSARRRRRIEIEDEDDDYGDDNNVEQSTRSDYKENSSRHHSHTSKDTDEEGSDNSEDDIPVISSVLGQRVHRNLKSSGFIQQPPNKRSRISLDVTNLQENPLMRHEPLVASTPAVGHSLGSGVSHLPMFMSVATPHLTHSTNFKYREEHTSPLTHNSLGSAESQQKRNINASISQSKLNEQLQNVEKSPSISSRRTLHLPSTSQAAADEYTMSRFSNINHQPSFMVETNLTDKSKLNGRAPSYVGNKRQKLINGTEEIGTTIEGNEGDSASESSEGCSGSGNGNITIEEVANSSVVQKKTGLFNMSSVNSRNASRTSSFGNGINFYSHLEGRKSLFSSTAQGGMSGGALNVLNNSTLSLTSLNRRQFNASIYGSTSALSDSRLLNTFSPFYKGKTTYGGAAAYKKYGAGAGATATAGMAHITPTLIRPTSSLSTLSSSNNSLAATGGHSMGPNGNAEASAISSTAKRILDLINDFATPLSEAKKMANSIKTNQQQLLPQTKSRLNDADLQASRALRLSQLRTPYMRPVVTLHPTKGKSLPPVRELQVPSMSQLLQMKKMQSSTERSRQITMQNTSSVACSNVSKEYTLPISVESIADGNELQLQQQKHTNKIKNKRSSARITASKDVTDLVDDEPPPSVNLPDIAFPMMQSVPKFDIALPVPPVVTAKVTKAELRFENAATEKAANATNTVSLNLKNANYYKDLQKPTEITVSAPPLTTLNKFKFKFSAPLEIKTSNTPSNKVTTKNYKFSPPDMVSSDTFKGALSPVSSKQQSTDVPILKSGSVLDVLKKPFTMPNSNVNANEKTSKSLINESNTFGAQFKKCSGKWECNTCLVHNEELVTKCVACETPRSTAGASAPSSISKTSTHSSFGSQFKKPFDEWECDTCMIRNKEQSSKCVACETPRKSVTSSPKGLGALGSQPVTTLNSFGDAFKPKANTWECPTCLINNKNECNECVACQSKKPGSNTSVDAVTAPTIGTNFKFGFNQPNTPTKNIEDAGFKSIAAAQKASKWECEACMTRNDAERLKCVCCEQAKPGTQTVSDSTPKFSFGSTAASKYTFGFGTNMNTSKEGQSETDTAKGITELKADTKSKGFVFGSSSVAVTSASTGFTFGITPTTSTKVSNSDSKDAADGSNISKASAPSQSIVGFKFGANTSVTTSAPASTTNFSFGTSKSTDVKAIAATTATTTINAAIPSVKISFAESTVATEPLTKPDSAKGFSFGNTGVVPTSSQSNLQTSGGFAFEVPIKATTDQKKQDGKTAVANFNFKAPSAATNPATTNNNNMKAFSFGTLPVSAPQSTNLTSTTATTTAALKPAFNFGNSTLSTTPISSAASSVTNTNSIISTTSTPTLSTGGFSFGTSNSLSSSVPKTIFGASVASINATLAPSASIPTNTFSTGKATINVFGSVGNSTTTSATTTSTTLSANIAKTAVSQAASSVSAFGSLNQGSQIESKLTAPATVIFGSNSAIAGTVTTTPFAFGSTLSTVATANSTATSSVSSTSWPKSNFVFGSTGNNNVVSNANEASNQPVFGSFGSMQTTAIPTLGAPTSAPSIFGNPTTVAPSAATTTFGSAAATTNTSNIFGSNTTATAPTTNLFGNASANAPPSAFGTAPAFGSSNNNGNPTPTFGSATSVNPAFGGFGPATNTATTNDGVSAAKKPELAFNFGANTAQSTTGGFNFGANAGAASKPAFNFAATNAPTFNFTGSNEAPAAKPFLFGAAPSAPVFNFSGGAVEGTPNAPFQFSAGAAPASSNIFAPAPTPGAQTALQARRKIRQPTRRLTPR